LKNLKYEVEEGEKEVIIKKNKKNHNTMKRLRI